MRGWFVGILVLAPPVAAVVLDAPQFGSAQSTASASDPKSTPSPSSPADHSPAEPIKADKPVKKDRALARRATACEKLMRGTLDALAKHEEQACRRTYQARQGGQALPKGDPTATTEMCLMGRSISGGPHYCGELEIWQTPRGACANKMQESRGTTEPSGDVWPTVEAGSGVWPHVRQAPLAYHHRPDGSLEISYQYVVGDCFSTSREGKATLRRATPAERKLTARQWLPTAAKTLLLRNGTTVMELTDLDDLQKPAEWGYLADIWIASVNDNDEYTYHQAYEEHHARPARQRILKTLRACVGVQ